MALNVKSTVAVVRDETGTFTGQVCFHGCPTEERAARMARLCLGAFVQMIKEMEIRHGCQGEAVTDIKEH